MKVLVTGGAGFLGSHLCDGLVQRGHEVVVVDDLSTGQKANLKPEWTFFAATNFSGEKVDAVFHLASPAAPGDIQKNPANTYYINSQGTAYWLHFAKRWNAKFLFVSTLKVHGNCERVEPYIKGKREGELICSSNGAKVARLGNVYGPRMRMDDSRVIPVFITRALRGEPLSLWNGGQQMDSFCFVSDIVEGLIDFMDSDESGVIEIGFPVGVAIKDLAEIVLKLTHSQSKIYTTDKVMVVEECHKVPDLKDAVSRLGWSPKVGLLEGLTKTIEYFKEVM